MEYKSLTNGVTLPKLGYGTFQIPPEDTKHCILEALRCGYRLFDTAASYANEKEIGEAILESGIPREEIFLATKVWIQDAGYAKTREAFERSCANLGVSYIDIYLIHQPYNDYYGSWRAMEELYDEGRIKVIGVCNFSAERLVDLCMNSRIQPMLDQVEFHPLFAQKELNDVLAMYPCQLEAWGPLNEGQRDIFHHPELIKIAAKYDRTVAQIVLRWHMQHDVIAIPKTVDPQRMEENMAIFDFRLDEADMAAIDALDIGYSEIIDHQSYMTAKWLNKYKIHD